MKISSPVPWVWAGVLPVWRLFPALRCCLRSALAAAGPGGSRGGLHSEGGVRQGTVLSGFNCREKHTNLVNSNEDITVGLRRGLQNRDCRTEVQRFENSEKGGHASGCVFGGAAEQPGGADGHPHQNSHRLPDCRTGIAEQGLQNRDCRTGIAEQRSSVSKIAKRGAVPQGVCLAALRSSQEARMAIHAKTPTGVRRGLCRVHESRAGCLVCCPSRLGLGLGAEIGGGGGGAQIINQFLIHLQFLR